MNVFSKSKITSETWITAEDYVRYQRDIMFVNRGKVMFVKVDESGKVGTRVNFAIEIEIDGSHKIALYCGPFAPQVVYVVDPTVKLNVLPAYRGSPHTNNRYPIIWDRPPFPAFNAVDGLPTAFALRIHGPRIGEQIMSAGITIGEGTRNRKVVNLSELRIPLIKCKNEEELDAYFEFASYARSIFTTLLPIFELLEVK